MDKFRYTRMSGSKREVDRFFSELSSRGDIAIKFFLADNGKTRELKERCTSECLEFLNEKKPINGSLGVFCAYFDDISPGFKKYIDEYYVGRDEIREEIGNEFVLQYQEVGRMMRRVSKSYLNKELEDRYIKDPHYIDLSDLGTVDPRLFMKIIRGSNETSIPNSGLLAEEKIVDAFKLRRFL